MSGTSSPSRRVQRTSSCHARASHPTWAIAKRAPARTFRRELQQLRHEVALDALERVHRAAGVEDRIGSEVLEQREQPHRVDVEDRARQPAEALLRVVARQRQDVGQALAREPEGDALERGATAIAAREMDDDVAAHLTDRATQRQRPEADVPAGVVGDRDRGHARVGREAARELEVPAGIVVLERAGPRHELDEGGAAVGVAQGVGEGGHPVMVTRPDGAVRSVTSSLPSRGSQSFPAGLRCYHRRVVGRARSSRIAPSGTAMRRLAHAARWRSTYPGTHRTGAQADSGFLAPRRTRHTSGSSVRGTGQVGARMPGNRTVMCVSSKPRFRCARRHSATCVRQTSPAPDRSDAFQSPAATMAGTRPFSGLRERHCRVC